MGFLLALALLQAGLIRDLGDDSVEVRDRAARRLRAIGEEALPDLKAADRHPDAEVRSRALALIRRIEAEACFDPRILSRYPELSAALEDKDHGQILGLSYSSDRVEFEAYAVRCLSDPSPEVRNNGLRLLQWVRESNPRVQRATNSLLIPLIEGWDPETSKDWDRKSLQWVFWLVMDRVSDADRPRLARAKGAHFESQQALRILQAAVGLPEATETLVQLLGRGTPWLRLPALQAARKGRCTAAREAVIALLSSPKLGAEAVTTLVEIADESCRPAIEEALNALAPSQRPQNHGQLLGRLGPRPQLDAPAAAEPRFPEPIRMRIEVPPDTLRTMLADWDGALEKRKSERKHVARCGLAAQFEVHPPDGGDILSSLAATGDRSLSSMFVDRLAAPDWECQEVAIRICGEWKLQEAAPILRRLAGIGRPEVRARALKSLALLEKN